MYNIWRHYALSICKLGASTSSLRTTHQLFSHTQCKLTLTSSSSLLFLKIRVTDVIIGQQKQQVVSYTLQFVARTLKTSINNCRCCGSLQSRRGGCWANRTPWYMMPFTSIDTTSELSKSARPSSVNNTCQWKHDRCRANHSDHHFQRLLIRAAFMLSSF